MCAYIVLLRFSLLASLCNAQKVIDLTGTGWTLKDSNGSISVQAHVPSDQYVDLYNDGVIGDPIYGSNDTAEMWVQLSNWTYVSPPIHGLESSGGGPTQYGASAGNGTKTWLVFEGLDTFAYITMCNREVGNTNNQFRQWLFDVTDVLGSCNTQPRLSINFGSAVKVTHQIANSSAADSSDNVADSCSADNEFGCKIYARKEQNDFGWDWSPSLAPAGPWRPIYAVQLTKKEPVYVNNALIDIFRNDQRNNLSPDQSQPWVVNASLDFVGDLPIGASLEMTLKDANGGTVIQTALSGVYHSTSTITGSVIIDPSKVELWWPSGMGAQNLYNATVSIVSGHNSAVLTEVERRVGFRTIVLNLNTITSEQLAEGIAPGANWHFEINGHEMYAKGSNLVPPSPFWPTVNETKMRQLFELVTEGNQNMLRVWASGAYLDDWIYDIADEMGILLWSEFEFSDAEYPNTTEYLQNYEAEAYYNVRRVNHHPSLALWVGGNELEQIILAYFFSPTNPSVIQLEYEQIFLELLIKCVYANTRSISYMLSSTYHGYLSLDFNRTMPQIPRWDNTSGPNAIYANSDYYNYNASVAFDLSTYPIGRFADEFGFHSMPSLQSWQSEAPPSDWYLESPTVVHHNRHYPFGVTGSDEQLSLAGIEEMVTAVNLWYPTPKISDPIANFTAWIYSTQVFQADFYQHQIAFYRRGSGRPERQLGSLYWMLEDLWAAPTWSSVDVLGRQKVVYYVAKDIYKPVIVYGYYNTSTSDLQVWVTSDLWSSVSGTVTYEWLDFAGRALSVGSNSTNSTEHRQRLNNTSSVAFTVGPINSTQVLEWANVNKTLASSGYNTSNAILRLSVTGSEASTGQTYSHNSYFHPASLAQAPLQDPGLTLTHGGSESSAAFTVKATKAVAAWVWIDYSSTAVQGYWSENGFWLEKGDSKTVTFTVWNDWSGGEWVDTVNVRSLWNNTML